MSVAFPEPSRVPEPSVVAPTLNTTVPVGTAAPGASTDTDAVSVTGWPNTDGDPDDEMTVAVAPRSPTTWHRVDVLAAKDASLLYVAVMVCDPTASTEVVSVAFPEPSRVPEPSVVVPSVNTTVPVGVPVPGPTTDTDAVNVTGCPNTDGDPDDEMTVAVLVLPTTCTAFDVLAAKDASLL